VTLSNLPCTAKFAKVRILNLAIGGNFGGSEVDDAIFPQDFVIDYVRVYQ